MGGAHHCLDQPVTRLPCHHACWLHASVRAHTPLQLRVELASLSAAEQRASSMQQQLQEAQQEAARLSGQAGAKDRHAAQVEQQLRQLQEQHASVKAEQQRLQQEAAASKAEATRLQGQLGAAGRLQEELSGLRQQLSSAEQRAADLQQAKAAAEREAAAAGAQVRVSVWQGREGAGVAKSSQRLLHHPLAPCNHRLKSRCLYCAAACHNSCLRLGRRLIGCAARLPAALLS